MLKMKLDQGNPELIRQYGDDFEKYYADKILRRIPHYAAFWVKYIGNDGRNRSLPMSVPRNILETRTYLWKLLYTVFESLALCWRLEEKFGDFNNMTTPQGYADNLNSWIAFYSHLGRICNMANSVSKGLSAPDIDLQFTLFWKQRNRVLHDPRMPMCWVGNVLMAPPIDLNSTGWNKNDPWHEATRQDLQVLSQIISSTLRAVEKVTDAFFLEITDLAPGKGFKPINWTEASLSSSRNVPPHICLSSDTGYSEPADHPVCPSGVESWPGKH